MLHDRERWLLEAVALSRGLSPSTTPGVFDEGRVSKDARARLRAGTRWGFDEPACASLRLPCDARASGQVRKLGPEYRASNSADLGRKRPDPDTLRFSAAHRRPSGCPPAALPDAVRCSAMSRSTLVPQGRGGGRSPL